MSRDQVWERIKSDQSEIYGMKMLDVFLMLAKELDAKHFNELSAAQKKKIGPEAAVDLLTLALIYDSGGGERFKKLAEDMGIEVLSKLDDDQIGYILSEMIANLKSLEHAFVFGDNLRKLKNTKRRDWVLNLLQATQNKHNNNGTTEILEQLLGIYRKYEILDDEIKEDLLHFIGTSDVPMKVFEEELKNMKSHEIAEIIAHIVAKFAHQLDLKVIFDKIKELKEFASDELKKIIQYEPVLSDRIKIELKSRDMLEFWPEFVKAIQS